MDFLLSAQGGDITTWRAAGDFVTAYRQILLDRAASDRCAGSEAVFAGAIDAVDAALAAHRELMSHLESLMTEMAETSPSRREEMTIAFYNGLYRHYGRFRSAPAFYQLSMLYLRRLSAAIFAQAITQLGAAAGDLPDMALMAAGPAGRGEYSPFCPLQILLVHDDGAPLQLHSISLLCEALHAGFEEAGLAVDQVVTPRNARWRGTPAEWRSRCAVSHAPRSNEELVDLCRLIDLYPLYPAEGLEGLKRGCSAALGENRPVLSHLVERMTSLSNGLGLMGRLKLERSGSGRGLFRLVDHGLLPFSAALSALTLIRKSGAGESCEKIRDLLKRRELDVDLAERMLATWHSLNDLRLRREQTFPVGDRSGLSMFLNPEELTAEQRQDLKDTLEAVAFIQRHVEIIFSGTGE